VNNGYVSELPFDYSLELPLHNTRSGTVKSALQNGTSSRVKCLFLKSFDGERVYPKNGKKQIIAYLAHLTGELLGRMEISRRNQHRAFSRTSLSVCECHQTSQGWSPGIASEGCPQICELESEALLPRGGGGGKPIPARAGPQFHSADPPSAKRSLSYVSTTFGSGCPRETLNWPSQGFSTNRLTFGSLVLSWKDSQCSTTPLFKFIGAATRCDLVRTSFLDTNSMFWSNRSCRPRLL
jgi:hypothetical protein